MLTENMKKLPLAEVHRSLGAEFMPFGDWEMPLKYTSFAEEHLAIRNSVGMFDISHMGRFLIRGEAEAFLQRVTSNDVSKLEVGRAHYSTILNERGGTKDDELVYHLGEREFMLVSNAMNVEKINNWLTLQAPKGVEVENLTPTTLMLALQGPRAQEVLKQLTDFDLSKLKRYDVTFMEVAGIRVLVSRSGYTGEDGFELFLLDEPAGPVQGEKLWNALLSAGGGAGIKPCGLGARDTTRLEAGLCLYGQELTEEITPLEARIDRAVKFDKGDFIGREALLEQKAKGLKRARIGFRMLGPGVPRRGCRLLEDGQEVGSVTSGTFSPLLKVGIAMGYAPPELEPGDEIWVEIHRRPRAAEVVRWPFYDREKYGYGRR